MKSDLYSIRKIWSSIISEDVKALQFFQFLRFSTTILLSIILVKSGLPQEEIAIYEILLFMANFLSFFWSMGLKNALIAYYPSLERKEYKTLIFNVLIIFIVLSTIAASILFLYGDVIISKLTAYEAIPHVELIAVYVWFIAPTILTEIILMLHHKAREIVVYGVVIFFLQIAFVGAALWVGIEVVNILYGLIIWGVMRFVYLCWVVKRYSALHLRIRQIHTFLIFSFPLILHILIGNGMEYVDGFIVSQYFDEDQFPVFKYGARELPFSTIFVGALVAATIPLFVRNGKESLEMIKSHTTALMKWLFPLSAVLILLSPFVFPLIYNDEFRLSAQLFNIYILVLSSRILLPQIILQGSHKNRILVYSSVIELIVNVTLSLWWVQLWGMAGIAFATVAAYMLHKLILISYNKFKLGFSLNAYLNIKAYIGYNIILLLAFFISYLI